MDDDFAPATVIRWVVAERFTYAAVKTPSGDWFTTADVEVATGWEPFFEDLI